MITETEQSLHNDLADIEVIRRISLKVSHLFSMKEKQRRVMGEFLNSEVLNFNAPTQSVSGYGLTYQLGVIGAFSGRILLNLDPVLAEKITGILFASPGPMSKEDINSAMQELLNIFGGHLSTAFNEMGMDFDITTPGATDEDFRQIKDGRKILFRFSSHGEIVQFVLALKLRVAEGE